MMISRHNAAPHSLPDEPGIEITKQDLKRAPWRGLCALAKSLGVEFHLCVETSFQRAWLVSRVLRALQVERNAR